MDRGRADFKTRFSKGLSGVLGFVVILRTAK